MTGQRIVAPTCERIVAPTCGHKMALGASLIRLDHQSLSTFQYQRKRYQAREEISLKTRESTSPLPLSGNHYLYMIFYLFTKLEVLIILMVQHNLPIDGSSGSKK